jgi:glutamate--cysteine ligase
MATAQANEPSRFIESAEDLLLPFRFAEKPPVGFRIGAEAEKFGVDRHTGAPLHYADASGRSVQRVLDTLVSRHGWVPEPEYVNGPLIALRRGQASITLEPGGQLELSGAPLLTIHDIHEETLGHLAEIRDISDELNVAWLGMGFHPLAKQADLDWVPKTRYGIMNVYLPTKGTHGLDMMRRTSTVQANFDYENEADALRKLRVSLRLSPLVTAMFASSPFYEGKPFGGRSFRGKVWLSVDPDRQGLVPQVWHEGATYQDYVEWALDAGMFLVKRPNELVKNTGQTFRSFLQEGFGGHRATLTDWETHLNTLFPDVRLKRTLEVRSADSLAPRFAAALPALWTGLLYDETSLAAVDALTADYTYDEIAALRPLVGETALQTTFRGKPLTDLALQILDLSRQGLARRGFLDRDGRDEGRHLDALAALTEQGRCPADEMLDAYARTGDALKASLETAEASSRATRAL